MSIEIQTEDSNSEFLQDDSFPREAFWVSFAERQNAIRKNLVEFLKRIPPKTRVCILGKPTAMIENAVEEVLFADAPTNRFRETATTTVTKSNIILECLTQPSEYIDVIQGKRHYQVYINCFEPAENPVCQFLARQPVTVYNV